MGNDIFNEQIVKKERTAADTVKSLAILSISIFVSILLTVFIPYIGIMLAVLVIWLGLTLVGRLKKEFEYAFTNGDLDIDVIFNKAKRKRIISIDSKRILGFQNIKSLHQLPKEAQKVVDCSSGLESANLYALTYDVDHKKTIFLIEPNEQILKGIYAYAPKSVTGFYGVSK